MAITKIAGELLESNLIRSTDLAFNSNLLYVDVANGRIGIKTDSPANFALDVAGKDESNFSSLLEAFKAAKKLIK